MLYLFVAAFVLWSLYRIVSLTEFDAAPRIARACIFLLGMDFAAIAVLFATNPWWAPLEFTPGIGLGAVFVLAFNLFWLLGPIGNALLWGALGLWCLKKASDGGWYRGALILRKDA